MIRSNVGIVTLRLTFDEHWIGYHLKVACNKCDGGRRRGSCPRECGPMTRRESRSATPDRVSTLHRGAREVARRRTTPGNEPGAAVCTIAAIGPTPVRLIQTDCWKYVNALGMAVGIARWTPGGAVMRHLVLGVALFVGAQLVVQTTAVLMQQQAIRGHEVSTNFSPPVRALPHASVNSRIG